MIRRRVSTLLLTAIAVLVQVPPVARAALIPMDVLQPGDQLATLDTSTGLQWLDTTVTMGATPNELIAGYGGWFEQGWRYASSQEVCTLFVLNIGPVSPCPANFVHFVSNPEDVADFLSLFGTSFVVDDDFYGLILVSEGIVSSGDGVYGYAAIGNAAASFALLGVPDMELFLVSERGHGDGDVREFWGSFLVKPIPEPSTALLLAFGLGLCCLTSRFSGPGNAAIRSNRAHSGRPGEALFRPRSASWRDSAADSQHLV